MADAGAIGKDSRNNQQGFNFRGIDAVMNHLHPIFAKHGVVILPEVLSDKTEERETKSGGHLIYRMLRVQYGFMARDGSQVYTTVQGEGMDSGDKASNKAMAVALKYALTQMLLLPYDEVDPDATTPEPSTRKPVQAAPTTPPSQKPAATAAPAQTAAPAGEKRAKSKSEMLTELVTLCDNRCNADGTSSDDSLREWSGFTDKDGKDHWIDSRGIDRASEKWIATTLKKARDWKKGEDAQARPPAEPPEPSYTPERDGGGDDLPF
jgi:hypothetical protein